MHWTDVDGFQMPNRIGGHPALDFCNTWAGWAGIVDRKTSARVRRLAASEPARAREVVERAHRLRTDLYEFLTADVRGEAPEGLVAAIHAARAAQRFAVAHGEPVWQLPEEPELVLHAISLEAASLLVGGDLDRIGRCPGNDCGWLFRSSQRRRWCSMASCGNRAKVRAHAARERHSQAPGSA